MHLIKTYNEPNSSETFFGHFGFFFVQEFLEEYHDLRYDSFMLNKNLVTNSKPTPYWDRECYREKT